MALIHVHLAAALANHTEDLGVCHGATDSKALGVQLLQMSCTRTDTRVSWWPAVSSWQAVLERDLELLVVLGGSVHLDLERVDLEQLGALLGLVCFTHASKLFDNLRGVKSPLSERCIRQQELVRPYLGELVIMAKGVMQLSELEVGLEHDSLVRPNLLYACQGCLVELGQRVGVGTSRCSHGIDDALEALFDRVLVQIAILTASCISHVVKTGYRIGLMIGLDWAGTLT